jgi:glycosyltransferase involved in cell wall biosynthesis
MAAGGPSVTIILPTYKEKENLPLVTYLIDKHLTEA